MSKIRFGSIVLGVAIVWICYLALSAFMKAAVSGVFGL